jgi:putative DNA-invertase from lambdoid prophage Rac
LDQSVEAQRAALGGHFDREYIDEGVSGATPAADRPAFGKLLEFVREGDVISVYDVSRLGRDALDVQSTVRKLIEKGVTVEVFGLGSIGRGAGEIVLAVLAQVADMERLRIKERCDSGRRAARLSLAATQRTHRGKPSLGRSKLLNPADVASWRRDHAASIAETAKEFGVSVPTVKRYCAQAR